MTIACSKKDLRLLVNMLFADIEKNRQAGLSDHSESSNRLFQLVWSLDKQLAAAPNENKE